MLVMVIAMGSFALAPGSVAADDSARGEDLFDLCQQCHGGEAQGNAEYLAPPLAGLDEWYIESQLKAFKSGGRGMHPDDIPGMRMMPMSRWLRTDEDVKAVAGYIAKLPAAHAEATLEGGHPESGKASYAVCAACHGQNGEGNQAMSSPPLAGMSDWYLYSTLQRFKDGVRGTNPKNPTEMMMRGMALSLADDQAIKDVVAYIMTLDKQNKQNKAP
jgi:cytochrome c553